MIRTHSQLDSSSTLKDRGLEERYAKLTERMETPPAEESADPARPHAALTLHSLLEVLRNPVTPERQKLNQARYDALPPRLKRPEQIMGRTHHSCGATHSLLERCNFACTSCYLGPEANATKALPWPEVKAQLDHLRSFLGPLGKAQLTSGEVTLLPVDVLGKYIDYARRIGLDPMVMSHGERLLADPAYLERLVLTYGLEKLSIHIDVTQRGRQGWHSDMSESELNPVRDRYAELIRKTKQKTKCRLKVAHTVTVTQQNLEHIPDIIEWFTSNLDSFRMLSLQPVASVGRTEDEGPANLTMDEVWHQMCHGLGGDLNRTAWIFGHPECNILAPVLILRFGEEVEVLETARKGKSWDKAFLSRLHHAVGGFNSLDKSAILTIAGAMSLALRNLRLTGEAVFYGVYRLWGIRHVIPKLLLHLSRLRPATLQPLVLVVHKFMSPDELPTALGQERLKACVFKVPVDQRMVAMCEVNATGLRSDLNRQNRGRPSRSFGKNMT